ncbi:MAG: gene transfer agent family protein [Proteobacteria bacterium]|nr:gene transfer agent family protein [Pseudomonadota bacterium]
MPNLHRGEIEAVLDGRPLTMCLTLGALAELEAAFGDQDMLALATRFAEGRLSATDAIRILAAGLRGAGNIISDADVSRMQADGGAAGFVDAVARLLTATFGIAPATGTAKGVDALAGGASSTPNATPAPLMQATPDPFPGAR